MYSHQRWAALHELLKPHHQFHPLVYSTRFDGSCRTPRDVEVKSPQHCCHLPCALCRVEEWILKRMVYILPLAARTTLTACINTAYAHGLILRFPRTVLKFTFTMVVRSRCVPEERSRTVREHVRSPFANTFGRRSFAVAGGGVTVRAAFVFVRRSFAVDACTNRMFANRS